MPDDSNPLADALARGDVVAEEAPAEPQEEEQLDLDLNAVPEGDEEAEPVAEAAPAKDDDEDAQKGHMIPKTRFDQAVQKERERAAQYERELKQYREREQQLAQAANFEQSQAQIKEMLKQHSSLLADGDLDKASEVMEQVLQLRDDMQNIRMQTQADNARNSAKIEVQYDATVQRLETEYPEINPDSDSFDQDAVRRVQMMVTGIMQNEGKNPAQALMEATDILLKPAKLARGETLRDKPSQEAVESGLRRTQQQIDKNLKAAEQQPPTTREVGADHDKTGGVMDADMLAGMSFDEFMNVPDSELAKLRGDFLQ
jgi:hypothetical protein